MNQGAFTEYVIGERYDSCQKIGGVNEENLNFFERFEANGNIYSDFKKRLKGKNVKKYTKEEVDNIIKARCNTVNLTADNPEEDIGLYSDYIEALKEYLINAEKSEVWEFVEDKAEYEELLDDFREMQFV